MIRDVHSKSEYFALNLKMERKELNEIQMILFEIRRRTRINLEKKDRECYRCWYPLYDLNYNFIYSYIASKRSPIQQSYDDTLAPLKNLLITIYYLNLFSMTTIWKKPFRLLFVSTVLAFVNICINAELFIANAPSVDYILTISICIVFFSIWLLFQLIFDLLMLVHYRTMKNVLVT